MKETQNKLFVKLKQQQIEEHIEKVVGGKLLGLTYDLKLNK